MQMPPERAALLDATPPIEHPPFSILSLHIFLTDKEVPSYLLH